MELIDRYLHAVGRHLPPQERVDILAELRSALVDALEDRTAGEPEEAEIVALLQDFGPPRKVAASYHPSAQYLIGPSLFPLFRLVAGITIAAVVGAQILAWGVSVFLANDPLEPLNALAGLLNSIPSALGMVVIVFAILQWFDVQPDQEEAVWDPKDLPRIDERAEVKRGEKVAEIAFSIALLVVLVFFPDWVGFFAYPAGTFFANPVIPQYLPWITLALLTGIGLDIYLLWQGRWATITRIASLAVNLLTIAILLLLFQGHSTWLSAQGAPGFFGAIEMLEQNLEGASQLIGMHAFRLAFGIALIVTVIDTVLQIFRIVRGNLQSSDPGKISPDQLV